MKLTVFQLLLVIGLCVAQGALMRDWCVGRAEIRAFEAIKRKESKQVAFKPRKA